jgi:uncharacterized protein YjiS (DUF1127 family)
MDASVTYDSLAATAKRMVHFLEQVARRRGKSGVSDELCRLHDHLLDDIGLTRQQVDKMEREQRSEPRWL